MSNFERSSIVLILNIVQLFLMQIFNLKNILLVFLLLE